MQGANGSGAGCALCCRGAGSAPQGLRSGRPPFGGLRTVQGRGVRPLRWEPRRPIRLRSGQATAAARHRPQHGSRPARRVFYGVRWLDTAFTSRGARVTGLFPRCGQRRGKPWAVRFRPLRPPELPVWFLLRKDPFAGRPPEGGTTNGHSPACKEKSRGRGRRRGRCSSLPTASCRLPTLVAAEGRDRFLCGSELLVPGSGFRVQDPSPPALSYPGKVKGRFQK